MASPIVERNIKNTVLMCRAVSEGNVTALLGYLSAKIEWDKNIRKTALPYFKPRQGKAAVANYFKTLTDHIELTKCVLGPISGSDEGTVFVRAVKQGRNRKTGREIPETVEVHLWTFDQKTGLALTFAHILDLRVYEDAAEGAEDTQGEGQSVDESGEAEVEQEEEEEGKKEGMKQEKKQGEEKEKKKEEGEKKANEARTKEMHNKQTKAGETEVRRGK